MVIRRFIYTIQKAKLHNESKGSNGISELFRLAFNELLGLFAELSLIHLAGVVHIGLCLTLNLQRLDDALVLPANFVAQTSQLTVLASRVETESSESSRHDKALLLVEWRWDTFHNSQVIQCLVSPAGLVRHHTANGSPEDLGRGTVVINTTGWVDVTLLAQKGKVL